MRFLHQNKKCLFMFSSNIDCEIKYRINFNYKILNDSRIVFLTSLLNGGILKSSFLFINRP